MTLNKGLYCYGGFQPRGVVTLEAYCLKCKGQREVIDPEEVTLKNGRPATKGVCGTCSSKLFRIGKAS